MRQSLGLVEIAGLASAVVVADGMVKAANVELLGVEPAKGMGYMTIKVVGDVGAVNAAVEAGCQLGRMDGKLVSWKVIPRPSDALEQVFIPKETADTADTVKENNITEEKPAEAPAAEEAPVEAPAEEEKAPEAAPKKKEKAKKKHTEDSRD